MPENSNCSGASSCSKESCEGCPSNAKNKAGGGIAKEPMNAASNVKKVIGVVSGKGGVGKSFVTASLAAAMNRAVRNSWTGIRNGRWNGSDGDGERYQDHVDQPAVG